jgi:hypothetical protein
MQPLSIIALSIATTTSIDWPAFTVISPVDKFLVMNSRRRKTDIRETVMPEVRRRIDQNGESFARFNGV